MLHFLIGCLAASLVNSMIASWMFATSASTAIAAGLDGPNCWLRLVACLWRCLRAISSHVAMSFGCAILVSPIVQNCTFGF